MSEQRFHLGVDTGGTFTDFVCLDKNSGELRIHKVLSTPKAPEQAILQGIEELGLQAAIANNELAITHGSTVATNAALEGKGVKTAYIANSGLEDVLSIGRQTRSELYNLQPEVIQPPVAKALCFGANTRLSAQGESLNRLTNEQLDHLVEQIIAAKVQACAINLLFSFLDNSEEERIKQALAAKAPEIFTCISSYVLPEYKEYERGIATWLNAYLGPLVASYLERLQNGTQPSPLGVMQSSGGTIDATQAGQRAVNLLLSGPAGGLAAAEFIGRAIGEDKLMTFDMGGTSTDVALLDGGIKLTTEGKIGRYPAAVPMVDMHTIGAGGGSIAYVDAGGMLQVGPESAGANPGPACYGQGGKRPAVTDANAVLGRLRPDNFLGGAMSLDLQAAQTAVGNIATSLDISLVQAAQGIITLANEHMTRALRVISVQRGFDPKDFRLCCFGGAGGLHVCALADNLNMTRALVPVHGGVLSALGMLAAQKERQLSKSHQAEVQTLTDPIINEKAKKLMDEGVQQLIDEAVSATDIQHSVSLDLRYLGQSYTLNIDYQNLAQAAEDFADEHEQRYGHRLQTSVELVNIRVRVYADNEPLNLSPITAQTLNSEQSVELLGEGSDGGLGRDLGTVTIYQRSELKKGFVIQGPALICEQVSTTLVSEGWQAQVDHLGNLLLDKQ